MERQVEMFGTLEMRAPKRRGRPKACISERKRFVAEAMLRAGATAEEIAAFLGVSRPTVRGLFGEHPSWISKPGARPGPRTSKGVEA